MARKITVAATIDVDTGEMEFSAPGGPALALGLAEALTQFILTRQLWPALSPRVVGAPILPPKAV